MRRLFLFLTCASATISSARAQELIWAQHPTSGHWYGTSYAEMTWFDAEAASIAQGGHLASFDAAAELDWAASTFTELAASSYWIGLNDVSSEGTFAWTSGEPVTFTSWAPGEPDDHFGIEDAVEMQPFDAWRWHDAHAIDLASRRPLAETAIVPRYGWRLPESYPVGTYAYDVVAALIDGDSNVDLVVINGGSDTVRVLRGSGTGTFEPLSTLPIGCCSNDIATGDFNQDQITDLALAVGSYTGLRVVYGLGTGVFVNGPTLGASGIATSVYVADLDGDARDDVVLGVTYPSNGVNVFLANGAGSFYPAVVYPPGGTLGGIAISDVDNDGDRDLVVTATNMNTVRVFANAGNGTFAEVGTFATGVEPLRPVCADLDGDGNVDVAVPCRSLNRLQLHFGMGGGQLTGGYDVATGQLPAWTAVLDVDGDGLTDIAVGCHDSLALHKNRGGGTLLPGELVPLGPTRAGLVVRDFDGDGRPDAASVAQSANTLQVLRRLSRDCNGNGTDDPRDIELATSADCNANGEPDECDLALGAEFDCDADGAIDACEIAADPSLDLDGDLVLDACESAGDPYCFGDGSGTGCPCGPAQLGDPGHGCRNSSGTSGLLAASGNAGVALDSVTLRASELPSSTLGLFFQGDQATNGGLGSVFGDGLRCAGQNVVRLAIRSASGGSMSFGHGIAGDSSVSSAGQVPVSGATRFYQLWYRDAAAFCTSATWNLTNGVRVAWTP